MKRYALIAYIVVAMCIIALFARNSIEPSLYLYERSPEDRAPLMIIGWVLATLVPIILSMSLWLFAQHFNRRWLIHLIFVPIAITAFRSGQALFLYGANTNGVNSPDGYSMMIGSLLLMLSAIVHIMAGVVEGVKSIKRHHA